VTTPAVFISSTAEDLGPYRTKAREAAERAGFRVIGMESFEGRDERPLVVCQEKIAQCDVVVAIVAHRYGWVPPDQPPAADGSQDKSITWLECEHAKSLGQEVLAFLVDDDAPWPASHVDGAALAKRAAPEELARVQRIVQRLGDFKEWLGEGTRPRFKGPEDLCTKVLHALEVWKTRRPTRMRDGKDHSGAAATLVDPRKYLDTLAARTAYIDIRGLQVGSGKAHRFPIDDLYITLTTATAEGRAPRERPRYAGRSRTDTGGDTAKTGDVDGVGREGPRRVALHEALHHERLVIVGDPGSGKTTFLHRVAHALCQTYRGNEPDAASRRLGLDDRTLPVLVKLVELAEHVTRHRREGRPGIPVALDAPAWLPHFLAAQSNDEAWDLGEEFFRKTLDEGPCLVLLDGLDEAPDRVARESLSRLVENVARAYRKARVVVTSRPGAYVGAAVISDFVHVHIEPLGTDAVQTFLTRWSEAIWPGALREALHHRDELVRALRVPDIARLAQNPVMLTALAIVHWNERRLPEQRADLYESIIKWLSRAREQRPARPGAERCVALLQELALAMQAHREGRRIQMTLREAAEAIAPELRDAEFRDADVQAAATQATANGPTTTEQVAERRRLEAAERFLIHEELDSGIVVGRGHELRFWHLTFQEFLAARAVAGWPEAEQHAVLLAGDGRLHAAEWREVVLLMAGVLHQHGSKRVDKFVADILTAVGPEPPLGALARCVGLLGAIQRDLTPFGYEIRDERYRLHLDHVMAIFDAERSQSIPIQVRIDAADALGQAGDARLDPANPNRWVLIPAGVFMMGAQDADRAAPNFDNDAYEDESPVHEVAMHAYRVSRYPVTVGEYRLFVGDRGYDDERWWRAGGHGSLAEPDAWAEQELYPTRPIVGVNWYEAKAFCAWASGNLGWVGCRLPTEAEWERAARGAIGRKFPWGNAPIDASRANYDSQVGHPTPVGLYPLGATPDGIHDLSGNVLEWCDDAYHSASSPARPRSTPSPIGYDATTPPGHRPASSASAAVSTGEVTTMRYELISADCHVDLGWLPPDLFVANAAPALRDRMPYVTEGPKGPTWTRKGAMLGLACGMGSAGREYVPGVIHRADRMAETGLYADGKRGVRRELRLKDQDLDCVQAEVLYGILGTTGRMHDPEVTRIDKELGHLPEDVRRQIVCKNALRLYGFAS
jgi:formylglycine-generating enzyme required for sulfatase activity